MLNRATAGRMLVVVAAVGVVASLLGAVVGLGVLRELELTLERSLLVSSRALDGVDASIELAEESATLVERSLADAETATRDLVVGFDEAERLLRSTADLSEDRLAGSLESVEETLPALVDVAAVIDRTLRGLAALPFGPTYDPEAPFDESLRTLEGELEGMPDDLRAQAQLVRGVADSLAGVRDGTVTIGDDLAALRSTMRDAAALLRDYTEAAGEARSALADSVTALGDRLALARVLLVVLTLTMAVGQVVPAGIGWFLLRPEAGEAFLRRPAAPAADGVDDRPGREPRPARTSAEERAAPERGGRS